MFAISLSCRAAIIQLDSFRLAAPDLAAKIDQALSDWRVSMLTNISPNRFDHHLFFLDVVTNVKGTILPDGFHWYTLRGVDATIVSNSTDVSIYVKLPGMFFFSSIHPAKPTGWLRTKIHQTGRIVAAKQVITYGRFGEFLTERARQAMVLGSNLSSKQEQRITDTVLKDRKKRLPLRLFAYKKLTASERATAIRFACPRS